MSEAAAPDTNQKMSTGNDRNPLIDALMVGVVALMVGFMGFTVYQKSSAGAVQESLTERVVIFDTKEMQRALSSGESDYSAREVREILEKKAAELAAQGYIVIRSEMIWDAPDEYYIRFE